MYKDTIKNLRIKLNKTQEEIADILGVERGTYSQYEIEYIIMPIKHLNTICNYFNISFDYLFNFSAITHYSNYKKEINNKLSGLRIKELRKKNNLTLNKLSSIINYSYGTIAGYESGRYTISTPFLYEICKKYKISADYLLGKIDEPKYLK